MDEKLGLSRSKASKHLAKAITWLSVFMPFNEVKKIFAGLLGVSASTTFIEQVAVRVGDTRPTLYLPRWGDGSPGRGGEGRI